ncbi:hypothetical protein KC19_1G133100 [Ceratodon purpureus]|uniref:Replication factor-A protein 1 N-terminal domain-containing protein n=2 Tax=Ceratodon purpureus TaxID=3225 RepID=A0A8T0J7Q7_CERPU|nr:hypothetical protein KC19_1G133100 [Ceratodon purpureus]
MGLTVSEVMDYRGADALLKEPFTSLEEIVYPSFIKAEDGRTPVLQIFDMYAVRKAGRDVEQWRVVLSDAEYYVEAVLGPVLVEGARSERFKKGSIVRIVEYEVYECRYYEYFKRIIKVIELEVLVVDFRVVGDGPVRLNYDKWLEEDWNEESWVWVDPEEQEYEEEGSREQPCGFCDPTEAITSGAIKEINTNLSTPRQTIVLQIMDIRSIGNDSATRTLFGLVLSDGTHLQHAVLATALNDKVNSNLVIKGSIVYLLKYACNTVQDRFRILIVLEMEVHTREADIVGNPIHFRPA